MGYKFKNPGSVTSDLGWTGYYDTTLRNGQEVLPGPYVNDAMGYDPTVSGHLVIFVFLQTLHKFPFPVY